MKYVYGIEIPSISKSLNNIYGKGLVVVKYELQSKVLAKFQPKGKELQYELTLVPCEVFSIGKMSDKELVKMKNRFDKKIVRADVNTNVKSNYNLFNGSSAVMVYFETFEQAKVSKIKVLTNIELQYKIKADELIKSMHKNLPKQLPTLLKEAKEDYPEEFL